MKVIAKKQLVWSLCLLSSLIMTAAVPSWGQEKVVKLRYTSYFPPTHEINQLSDQWCKEVEKRTDGRVKITLFAGNTLTSPTQNYDSVVKGIADIGLSTMSMAGPGRFPLTEVLSLPLGITSGYQATKLANEYYRKLHPKEFDDVKVMYFFACGPGVFHMRKPVSSMGDLRRLRIKANAETDGIVKAIGGVPVNIPITENYDALSKGLLDGLMLPKDVLKGWRFAEVVKGTLEVSALGYTSAHYVVMNKDKWNSISKADQQAIEKINDEWIEKTGKVWNELDKAGVEEGISKGMKIVKESKEDEAWTAERMKPLLTDYVKAKKAKGLPAEEALQVCLDYVKTHP